jgi:hypothetical protein
MGRALLTLGGVAVLLISLFIFARMLLDQEPMRAQRVDQGLNRVVAEVSCPPRHAAEEPPPSPLTPLPAGATPVPARAIRVIDNDRIVDITEDLSDTQQGFVSTLRLRAERADVEQVRLVAADLPRVVCPDDRLDKIHADAVTLAGGEDLPLPELGRYRPYTLEVDQIPREGLYVGDIGFVAQVGGEWVDQEEKVRLAVEAKRPPVLAPTSESETVSLQVVKCEDAGLFGFRGWELGECWLSGFLLPEWALENKIYLDFRNDSWTDIRVGTPVVDLTLAEGEEGGRRNIDAAFVPDGGFVVPYKERGGFWVTLDRGEMAPGQYVGSIEMELGDDQVLMKVPVNLSVRAKPVDALRAILVGLLAGIGWRVYQANKGGAGLHSWPQRLRDWFTGGANPVWTWVGRAVAVLTFLVTAGLGLITEYSPDHTFGNDQARDYVALVVWGFGSQALANALGKLTTNSGMAINASITEARTRSTRTA